MLAGELQLAGLDLDDALSHGHQMSAMLQSKANSLWKFPLKLQPPPVEELDRDLGAAMGRAAVDVAIFLDDRGVEEDAGGRDNAVAAAPALDGASVSSR